MTTSGLLPTPAVNEPGWKNRIPVDKNGKTPTHHNQRWYDKETGRVMQKGLQQVLTYLPEDFPASRSVELESEKEQQTTATSGQKCVESFKNLPHVTSWQRMFADSLVSTGVWSSSKCVLTWKLLATKSNRLLFQLVPSTPRTEGIASGSSLILTTRASMSDAGGGKPRDTIESLIEKGQLKNGISGTRTGLRLQPDFAGWMMGYPLGYLDLEDGEMPRSKRTGTQSSPK